jgi:hypothetical protein
VKRAGSLLLVLIAAAGCAARRHAVELRQAQQVATECSEQSALQEAQQRASQARIDQLEAEIARLQSDLSQAQEVIVAAESQLSGAHTRALAVRSVAEARSALESSAARAPWKRKEAEHAREFLAEADQHAVAGHFGAAILLASRAARVASAIDEEVRAVRGRRGTLQVAVARANLREGPSMEGKVVATLARGTPLLPERREADWMLVRTPQNRLGWVHRSLVEALSGGE